MFEHHTEPMLSQTRFLRRMLEFLLVGVAIDVVVVVLGVLGFRATTNLSWSDALLDASMVITGNGPAHAITSPSGKVFVTLYALAGEAAYVIVIALVLSPVAHRLLHQFHLRQPSDVPEPEDSAEAA